MIRSDEKSNDLVGDRTHGHLAHSVVPEATTLAHASRKLAFVLVTSLSVAHTNFQTFVAGNVRLWSDIALSLLLK
jgi:hypothetical protein